MGRSDGADDLDTLPPERWPAYLTERSGLPGPRANLPLAIAAARRASEDAIAALLSDGGEFPVMCAAAARARRSAVPAEEHAARALAADDRWRVREGVAIGLQLRAEEEPAPVAALVLEWVGDTDPLVQRAAIAAICEPRLLRTPEMAAAALDACRRATDHLAALPTDRRTAPSARTLRQALGYCWSVAVAADPARGIPAFQSLDSGDPDVAWIVKENLRKKRLASLL